MTLDNWKKWGWQFSENRFSQGFIFEDFQAAMSFINKVGILSERLQHHPRIVNLYNEVVLELWTHETNGITTKDHLWIEEFQKERTL